MFELLIKDKSVNDIENIINSIKGRKLILMSESDFERVYDMPYMWYNFALERCDWFRHHYNQLILDNNTSTFWKEIIENHISDPEPFTYIFTPIIFDKSLSGKIVIRMEKN